MNQKMWILNGSDSNGIVFSRERPLWEGLYARLLIGWPTCTVFYFGPTGEAHVIVSGLVISIWSAIRFCWFWCLNGVGTSISRLAGRTSWLVSSFLPSRMECGIINGVFPANQIVLYEIFSCDEANLVNRSVSQFASPSVLEELMLYMWPCSCFKNGGGISYDFFVSESRGKFVKKCFSNPKY